MAVTKAILEKWMVAQKRHRLSDKQVQMARELGLNPDKLGKIDNHKQEPWKAPLPQFIEHIYFKRFKREEPETVRKWRPRRNCKKRKRRNGGNSVPSFPIPQQSKQCSHDMKRSLKAVRFSGFAFLVIRTNYRFFIPHEECPFLFSVFPILPCPKSSFLSFGKSLPM